METLIPAAVTSSKFARKKIKREGRHVRTTLQASGGIAAPSLKLRRYTLLQYFVKYIRKNLIISFWKEMLFTTILSIVHLCVMYVSTVLIQSS
ncbi:BnaC03g75700D [Brassica napus]|uniref:(rape) hypothetical protein n=1 Tax=Brassica napus TaxID=3708 RepID=A0A078IRC1_BRANA|nr:unnamed protein product [Brassica napus]CDY51994.1 BnaC03g75700D [Brassica napus]